MPPPRYFPRAVVNVSDDQEVVLAVALALHRVLDGPRRRRRQLTVGSALVAWFASIGFSVALLLFSLIPAETILWGGIATVSTLAVIAAAGMYVASKFQISRRRVRHLAKAYWPIDIMPFNGGHLLWDSFSTSNDEICLFNVDGKALRGLCKSVRESPVALAQMASVVRDLAAMAQLTSEAQRLRIQSPTLTAQDEVVATVGRSWAVLRSFPRRLETNIVKLTGVYSAAGEHTAKLLAELQEFVSMGYSQFLETISDQIENALKGWWDYFGDRSTHLSYPPVVTITPPTLDETSTRLQQPTQLAFGYVLDALDKELSPQVRDLKREYREQKRSREESARTRRMIVGQSAELPINQLQDFLESEKRELTKIKNDVKSCEAKINASSDGLGGNRLRRRLDHLRHERQLVQYVTDSAERKKKIHELTVETAKREKQLEEVEPLERQFDGLTRLRQERERNISECQQNLDRAKTRLLDDKRQIELELNAELGNLAAEHESVIDSVSQPINLVKMRQASVGMVLAEARSQSARASKPTSLNAQSNTENKIVDFQRASFEASRFRIRSAVSDLVNIELSTKRLVADGIKIAETYSQCATAILLPVWLVRYDDSPAWEPLLSLCVAQPIDGRDDMLGCWFDESPFGSITSCLVQRGADWKLDDHLISHCLLSHSNVVSMSALANLESRGWIHPDLAYEIRNRLSPG